MAAPNRPNLAVVETIANRFVAANSLQPPVDVEALLAAKAAIEYDTLPNAWDALLFERGGKLHVVLSSAPHLNRQRFTCGHELGHIAIAWHPLNMVCTTVSEEGSTWFAMEREADAFAAAVLVPAEWLDQFKNAKLRESVLAVTDQARVSLEVAVRRLVESSDRAAAAWIRVGDRFRFCRSRHWNLRTNPLEPDAAQLLRLRGCGVNVAEFEVGERRIVECSLDASCIPSTNGDSKVLLRQILVDLDELDKIQRVNGTVSSGYTRRAGNSVEEIFEAIRQRFLQVEWANEIRDDPRFDAFVAAKAAELAKKTSSSPVGSR